MHRNASLPQLKTGVSGASLPAAPAPCPAASADVCAAEMLRRNPYEGTLLVCDFDRTLVDFDAGERASVPLAGERCLNDAGGVFGARSCCWAGVATATGPAAPGSRRLASLEWEFASPAVRPTCFFVAGCLQASGCVMSWPRSSPRCSAACRCPPTLCPSPTREQGRGGSRAAPCCVPCLAAAAEPWLELTLPPLYSTSLEPLPLPAYRSPTDPPTDRPCLPPQRAERDAAARRVPRPPRVLPARDGA